jgi:hypothetical protein
MTNHVFEGSNNVSKEGGHIYAVAKALICIVAPTEKLLKRKGPLPEERLQFGDDQEYWI